MRKRKTWMARMMIIVMLLCSITAGVAFADKAEQNETMVTSGEGQKGAATPTEVDPEESEEPEETEEPEEMAKPEESQESKEPTESDDAEVSDAEDDVEDELMLSRSTMNAREATPAEADAYITAKDPKWIGDEYPGWGIWDTTVLTEDNEADIIYTGIRLYRYDEKILEIFFGGGYNAGGVDLREYFTESGEYQFQAVFVTVPELYAPDEYWSGTSDIYYYEAPTKNLPTPTNLKWDRDKGIMTWDEVPEANGEWDNYNTMLYEKNPDDGEYEEVDNQPSHENVADMTNRMEKGATYKFKVMAYGDLIEYGNSEWSEFSDEFVMDTVAAQGNSIIEGLREGNIDAGISDSEKDILKLAIQVDENTAQNYAQLEEEYNEGEELAINIDENSGIDGDKVTIVGGILNGATGIAFEKTTPENVSNTEAASYRTKWAINISLEGDLPEELKFPVLVTMPIPENFVPERLTILHIKKNGQVEHIVPRINEADKTVSFAVTEFSTFVFVDKTSAGGSSSGGSSSSGGRGGRGSSGGSSKTSGTVTIDSKKGIVNSLIGIVTGTSDNNSKWISETFLNAAGGTEDRWKLQYVDGTYATGLSVTDAQGNVTEQPLWEMINGAWYAFGADGYAKSGLTFDPVLNGWFYIDINTGMLTGWQQINGSWHYFNTVSDGTKGIMFVNRQTPDGYYVNAEGICNEKNQA